MKARGGSRSRFISGLAVGGALALLAVQPRVATHAAGPRLFLSAAHQWITVSGYHFSTSGRRVMLDAYGLAGGSKILLAHAWVTPLRTSPHLKICLIGPLCDAGGFSVSTMRQAQDPCIRLGFSRLEVDASTDDAQGVPYLAAWARTTVTCPPPFVG